MLATLVMLGCQGEQAAEEMTEQAEEPATLGSMDEQYAWVGDLGDRDALPGKPLYICLLYTSPSPRDVEESRMPSSA